MTDSILHILNRWANKIENKNSNYSSINNFYSFKLNFTGQRANSGPSDNLHWSSAVNAKPGNNVKVFWSTGTLFGLFKRHWASELALL